MEFIEAPAFTRHLSEYLGDDEYRAHQRQLGPGPGVGDLIPGTGGFRKIRWADKLQGGSDTASGSGFEVYPRDSEEDAVFASGVCKEAADQRENLGEMGAGPGQAESSGGGAGSAGAPVSRHAGAAGKGGGGVKQCDETRPQMRKRRLGHPAGVGKGKNLRREEPLAKSRLWSARPSYQSLARLCTPS